MNGIKMSDCRFYVNEEERVIICVIPDTKFMLEDFVNEHFGFPDLNLIFGLTHKAEKEMYMPNSFMGKAVCSATDKWDEDLGRKIAFSRAKDKCYRSFFKRANSLVQMIDRRLNNMINDFNSLGMKLEEKKSALQEQIDYNLSLPKE